MSEFNQRQDRIETSIEGGDIASDGRTVWVNLHGMCVARFCPVSQEMIRATDHIQNFWGKLHHWQGVPEAIRSDWKDFVKSVESWFGVRIPSKHKPSYVP